MYEQRDLVTQIKQFIPCEDCKSEWYDPEPSENLLDWSRTLHNKVNQKLGRYANWDDTDLRITHKPECDVCTGMEFLHRFPWDFMMMVASRANSMEFLKTFNATYPCDVHRGTFLDEPQAEESTLHWVGRNRQKVDPTFVLPTESVEPCTDCPTT